LRGSPPCGSVIARGPHGQDIDPFRWRQQSSIACVRGHGVNDVALKLFPWEGRQSTPRHREFNAMGVIPGADGKEDMVAPSHPIQEAGQRAEESIEEPIANANGEVDNRDVGRHRRLVPFALEQPADRPIKQVATRVSSGTVS
jgi:hypothetical protein